MTSTPIVIGEHTLAVLRSNEPHQAQILHASILRGAPYEGDPCPGIAPINPDGSDWRLATPEDFETYRVAGAHHYFADCANPTPAP